MAVLLKFIYPYITRELESVAYIYGQLKICLFNIHLFPIAVN